MHLTLYIPPCHVISAVMEIDKRELSYHNPTYITEGNCYFKRLQPEDLGQKRGAGRVQEVISWLEIRCYHYVLMERLMKIQVDWLRHKAFLINEQIVAVVEAVW